MEEHIELVSEADRTFTPVTERQRIYSFCVDGELFPVVIQGVRWVHVSNTGHSLLTQDGVSHYVPFGWLHLGWEGEEGAPHFYNVRSPQSKDVD